MDTMLDNVRLKADEVGRVFIQVKPDNLENVRPVLDPHKFCKQWNEHDSAPFAGIDAISKFLDVSEQEPQGGEEEQDNETAPRHWLLRQRMLANGAAAAVFGYVTAVWAPEFVEAFHA
jgi:hypothetical protein